MSTDNISQDNIKTLQNTAPTTYIGTNAVVEQARCIIDELEHGKKITVKDLSEKIAAKTYGMSLGNVTNLVQMFLKDCKDITVEIGRNGGIYKGGKQKRVDNRPRCTQCNQVMRSELKKQEQEFNPSVL